MDLIFQQKLRDCFHRYFGDDLVAIILFGSRARGDAGRQSDYDIFLLVKNLPSSRFERLRWVRRAISGEFAEKIAITARTPEEFEIGFPSLYLDLGIDGIVLYDTAGYAAQKLQRIRAIIQQAKLERIRLGNEWSWEWQQPPQGHWEITWEGYHEHGNRR